MAKRRNRTEEQAERELTRKEIRLRERERERHRVLYMVVGAALGLAVLIVIAGALYQFAYVPNSTIATVAGEPIVTKDFWERIRLERNQLQNQLANMLQLQEQFGQQFFAAQISQIQAQLQSPFALGVSVLDKMIDEEIVAKEATERGITVSEDEVDQALREEVASGRSAITAPQATETAEAGVDATATATLWTPTPTPTIDASLAVTATATPLPTPEPLPTRAILSDTGYTEGINQLQETLDNLNSVSLADYRELVRARLLADKLSEAIGEERVPATEEQVHARHILIRVMTPTLTITDTGTITAPIATDTTVTSTTTTPLTDTVSNVASTPVTDTVTSTVPVTATAAVTATSGVTVTGDVTATSELTATDGVTTVTAVTGTVAPTTTASLTETALIEPPVPVERTDSEARALAEELRQRILAGEDFATLAQQYSDDTGSGAEGGDLDWFGRGRMVAPFEEAVFSLEVGEISEPIKTEFGYHIIEVLEKDEARPKDPSQLEQERQEAYNNWLQEEKVATEIERPDDLTALLPRDLR